MTHPGTPRDVNLAEWLNSAAYHPADTELKQLGHEAARKLIGELGMLLHQLLPASREKSVVFTNLEQVRHYANQALAVHGGPGEHVTAADVRRILDGLAVEMPSDPRVMPPLLAEGEAGDRRTALEDRAYALLRQELGRDYEITAAGYRRAAKAVVTALAPTARGGVALPADRPPLQPFTQFKYSTGEEPGMVRSILVKFQAHWEDPAVVLSVLEHDEGENHSATAAIDVDDPDVLDEIAAGITAAANRLRLALADR